MHQSTEENTKKNLKLIAKSSFIVFIGLMLSKIFTYLYKIIIARQFGPEIYGTFLLAFMVFGWFVAIATLGLPQGLLRFIPIYRGKKQIDKVKYIFRFSLILLTFTGILAGTLMFLSSKYIALTIFNNPELVIFLQFFSLLIPIFIIGRVLLSSIQSFEKIGWSSFISNIFQSSIKLILLALLILTGFKINSIIFSYFLAIVGVFLLSYIILKTKIPEIFGKFSIKTNIKKRTAKNFLTYSWPLMFYAFASSILFWVDTLFIGYFQGATEVGFYNSAVPIALLLIFIPQLFLQLFFPLINREYGNKKNKLIKELSKQVGKWILIFNLPLFFLMILFPGVIINILFGSQYLIAENSLRILSLGIIFFSIALISNSLISMVGKSKILLYNILIAGLLNVFLNLYLIPLFGIDGAALATSISYLVLSLMLVLESKHYTDITPLGNETLKILFVSLIPTILLLIIKNFFPINIMILVFSGIFFVLMYILLIYKARCLDEEDLMILKAIKKKIIFFI